MSLQQNYGTGRRKSSVARVFLRFGTGNYVVNGRPLKEYFPTHTLIKHALEPMDIVGLNQKFDLYITTHGGGKTGQAGAIRLGLARALVEYEQNHSPSLDSLMEHLQSQHSHLVGISHDENQSETAASLSIVRLFKNNKLLTRDDRRVERKKISLVKARKRPQYSKR